MVSLVPWRKRGMEVMPRRESPFRLMRREFETLFDRVFGEGPLAEWLEWPAWGVETEEAEKEYLVRIELPGFEPSELAVEVRHDLLTVRAAHEVKEGNGETKEVRTEEVRRSLRLPPGVEVEKIEARYHNGVLEIHLPKGPEELTRRIEVKT